MSLIEKIDAEMQGLSELEDLAVIEHNKVGLWRIRGRIEEAQRIKQFILSEQKEPLTIGDKIRESNESLSAFIRGQFGDDRVFHCGKQVDLDDYLNQPPTDEA